MKKILMATAALCCMTMAMLTSCTEADNAVIPSDGKLVITVNTASLYDELNIIDLMPQWLTPEKSAIIDSVFIYDQTGKLVSKYGVESYDIQPFTIVTHDLPLGTYTIVAWQTTRKYDGLMAWSFTGEEQLSTASLSTIYSNIGYMWALGAVSATVTVDGARVNADLSPKSLGSIIDLRVDNVTEDWDLKDVYLCGSASQHVLGYRFDPSLAEEDRWIMETENYYETAGRLTAGTNSEMFFTLTHGDNVRFDLYGNVNDGSQFWMLDGDYNLGTGENVVFYFDMDRLNWQPTFFGTHEDFTAWKADRDAGILVVDPCLEWGCSIDDVAQHVKAKQWWHDGNKELELWEGMGWHRWYYLAYSLTEQYLFETQDGQNLTIVLSMCHDATVPISVANYSLVKQGYNYIGKIVFPNEEPRDIFFSADGKTEVQTILYGDGRWAIFYQATDPNDFQYIIPEEIIDGGANARSSSAPSISNRQQVPAFPMPVQTDMEQLSRRAINE